MIPANIPKNVLPFSIPRYKMDSNQSDWLFGSDLQHVTKKWRSLKKMETENYSFFTLRFSTEKKEEKRSEVTLFLDLS